MQACMNAVVKHEEFLTCDLMACNTLWCSCCVLCVLPQVVDSVEVTPIDSPTSNGNGSSASSKDGSSKGSSNKGGGGGGGTTTTKAAGTAEQQQQQVQQAPQQQQQQQQLQPSVAFAAAGAAAAGGGAAVGKVMDAAGMAAGSNAQRKGERMGQHAIRSRAWLQRAFQDGLCLCVAACQGCGCCVRLEKALPAAFSRLLPLRDCSIVCMMRSC